MARKLTPKKEAAAEVVEASTPEVETTETIVTPSMGMGNIGPAPDISIPYSEPTQTKSAPKFKEFFSGFLTPSRLSADGDAYLTNVKNNIEKVGVGMNIKFMPIVIPELDAAMFYDLKRQKGVCLIFAESYINQTNQPPTNKLAAIMGQFKAQGKGDIKDNFMLITSIVVVPEEYTSNFALKMANSIINLIIGDSLSSQNLFSIDMLSNEWFQVCTNQTQVRDYISQVIPHIAPDRNDFGFLVRRVEPVGNGTQFYYGETLFAVSGYTRFITPYDRGDVNAKIIPLPVITSIVSQAPVSGYIPFAISVATLLYLRDSMWTEPYKVFAKDKPNLGNLVDAVNRPITNINEFNELLARYFDSPRLCIDITEGRYNLPDMVGFGDISKAYSSMERFFGRTEHLAMKPEQLIAAATGNVVYNSVHYNYNGLISDKSGLIDTRYVDYLRMATAFENNSSDIINFKMQPLDPAIRYNEISAHYPNIRMLYNTQSLIVAPEMNAYIARSMNVEKVKFHIIADYTQNIGSFLNHTQVASQPVNWAAGEFSIQGGTQFGNDRYGAGFNQRFY